METPNEHEVASLLDSLEDLSQAAELVTHEIEEIAQETDERVADFESQIEMITEATDTMIEELQRTESALADELDELMISELAEVDEEPTDA